MMSARIRNNMAAMFKIWLTCFEAPGIYRSIYMLLR
jgi:hypothetical protein